MFSAFGELQEQENDSNACQRCHRKVSSIELVNCETCRKIICNLCLICRNDDNGITTLVCESCEHVIVRNESTNDLTANEGDNQNQAINIFEETDEASLDIAVALSISEEPVQATNIDHESPSESNEEIQRQDGELTSTNSCNRCHIELSSEEKINCEICGKTICNECLICRNDNHGIGNLVCEPCEQVIVRNETQNDLTGNEGDNRNQTDNDEDSLDFAVALSLSEENIPVMRVDHESPSVSNVFSAFEQLQLLDGEITSTNSCNRCHIKLSSSEEKLNCEVCGKTFCTECRISRNDEHGIVNLVCEPCEQVIIGNKKNDMTELNRNESKNWNLIVTDFEENNEDDLDLAVALSKSEHERDVPPSTNTEPYYNAPECSVCCERRVNSMLHPCSHLCMCYECACEQWQGSGNGCCPLCRIPIEDVTSTR